MGNGCKRWGGVFSSLNEQTVAEFALRHFFSHAGGFRNSMMGWETMWFDPNYTNGECW